MRRIDLTGQHFGDLQVLAATGTVKNESVVWRCLCACGTTTEVTSNKLRTGHTKSCGCHVAKANRARLLRHTDRRSPTYRTWDAMIQRCCNPQCGQYERYGGAGIEVCDEWRDYAKFRRDMGERPEEHTIDRKDNRLGYFKENCRWATVVEQAHNKKKRCTSFDTAEEIRALRAAGAARKDIEALTGVGLGSIGGIIYAGKVDKPR